MKKALYSLALCALVLTSCTSVDKEGPQSNAITFRNVVSKDSRAMSNDNFGLFYVYGYYTKGSDLNTRFNIFTDTPVTKDPDGGWNSAINRYWIDGATYSFYAYSCENKHIAPDYGGPSIGQSDGVFRLNYSCHAEGGVAHDLIFASATDILGKESGNLPVSFHFKHILSKINLNFVSEFPEDYTIEISNISISQFMNTGTFTANKKAVSDGTLGSWGDVEYDGKVMNTFTLNTLGNSTTTSDKDAQGNPAAPVVSSSCYMIPWHYTAANNPVKIQFNIKVTNSANQTVLSNTLSGMWHPNWRVGTQYTYTVRLSGGAAGMEGIKFDVGISDWNDPKEDNKPEIIDISLDYQLSQNN